jgi:hypothetical protein
MLVAKIAQRYLASISLAVINQITLYDLIEVNEVYIFEVHQIKKSGKDTLITGTDYEKVKFTLKVSPSGGYLSWKDNYDGPRKESVLALRIVGAE